MANIAIVGAGFVGLSAAWDLAQAGHQVSLFEKNDYPGGLAAGFKASGWSWYLDHHYHHVFLSDQAIKNWVRELDLDNELFFTRPKTSVYYQDQVFQLDSPISLLKAPVLSPASKLRVASTLAGLKLAPSSIWKKLETQTAKEFLIKTMGQEAWQVLWQPLFEDKFAGYADKVNAAWFWARIKARTPSLGYFKGGFQEFALQVTKQLKKIGVKVYLDTPIKSIEKADQQFKLLSAKQPSKGLTRFDSVLVTLPAHIMSKLVKVKVGQHQLPWQKKLDYLSAVTLAIEADKSFFKDQTYWLNVNDLDFPFLAVVEHTHLVDKAYYGNKHIIYVGKYLKSEDKLYQLDEKELFQIYKPYLNRLSPGFSNKVKRLWRFQAPFAQPVVKTHHSHLVPKVKTPVKGLYWASMQHIYPWDRGTNFAVKLGRETAGLMNSEK